MVYEVKLGDEFLMSSMFTVAEEALADLGIACARALRVAATTPPDDTDPAEAEPPEDEGLAVLVGGLGLGYTAVAALRHTDVIAVDVIEALAPVISWHEQRLLPTSDELLDDPRVRMLLADFFAVIGGAVGDQVGARASYDVIALDIDHAPDFVLHPDHQGFYTTAGLRGAAAMLSPGGVFALWSDRAPDEGFITTARTVFDMVDARVVRFANPLTGGTSSNTVYLAHRLSMTSPAGSG
ncbi:MAG: spermidine synthase [Ornithinimicrobium sp.]